MAHSILVVDDDPHIRDVVRFAFEKTGMLISTAQDGKEALRQFVEGLYDTVIEHQRLFRALISTAQLGEQVQPAIRLLEQVSNAVAQANNLLWDTPVAARAALVMVVGLAISRDVIYAGNPPARDRIVDELTRMLIGAAGLPVPHGGPR